MNANRLSFRTWLIAAGLCVTAACGSTSGGGGGAFVNKDATGDAAKSDVTAATGDGAATSDMMSGDTMGGDMNLGGTDVMVVDMIDTPDVMTPDIKPDVPKTDVQKADVPVTGTCIATKTCDPVNNDCPGAGETCDIASDGSAGCFPPPNDVQPGGACDNANGPFCSGGYHCGPSQTCQKFCCSDVDCDAGKACTALGIVQTDSIGVCDP